MAKQVKIKYLENYDKKFGIPFYQTSGASGIDLKAISPHLDKTSFSIFPGQRIIVSTGISLGIPEGFEVQVRTRSGLAAKQGLIVANSPGTIDQDYTGEIKIVLLNTGYEQVFINHGDRIAQMVLCPVTKMCLVEDDLQETERGNNGFGSTGII